MIHQPTTFTIFSFNRARLFWFLIVILVLSVAIYLLLVAGTIMRVLEREESETVFRTLSVSVSEREAEYLSLGRDITLETAVALGYSEVAEAKYLSRAGRLSLNKIIK